ncbi:MAG: hypothetical protein M1416_02995 [Candidatus Pacearchaeota archaeon]|nr:hypothetical protein [Candidatus Pacearchaeota archaeon]
MKKSKKNDEKILFAWLATFLSLVGFIIALIVKRKDKYVMHYTKLSIVIFIISAVVGITKPIIDLIPVMGGIINVALGVLTFILWALSWIYALSGKEKEIPIISEWAEKIRL